MQWESIRLEAEGRLSMESSSSLYPASSAGKTDSDIFLKLWNSDVGAKFRDTTAKLPKQEASESQIGSSSYITSEEKPAITITCGSNTTQRELVIDSCRPSSDSISSNEFADSSYKELKLLLDLPSGTGIGFLQDQTDGFSTFLDLQRD